MRKIVLTLLKDYARDRKSMKTKLENWKGTTLENLVEFDPASEYAIHFVRVWCSRPLIFNSGPSVARIFVRRPVKFGGRSNGGRDPRVRGKMMHTLCIHSAYQSGF